MPRDTALPTDASTHSASLPFIEALYAAYRRDAASVAADWRAYFARLDAELGPGPADSAPHFARQSLFAAPVGAAAPGGEAEAAIALQSRVEQIIRAYRVRGHLIGRFDPLDLPRPPHPELEPSYYGLGDEHLDLRFAAGSLAGEAGGTLSLREILERLRETYSRSIGVQYMHIDDVVSKAWLYSRMETSRNRIELKPREQMRILIKLTDAVLFEEFVQKKYVGAKRFSPRGRREPDPAAGPGHRPGRRSGRRARSSSAWPIAAGSTCWPTSSARARARSSASSRTWTRSCTSAAAT